MLLDFSLALVLTPMLRSSSSLSVYLHLEAIYAILLYTAHDSFCSRCLWLPVLVEGCLDGVQCNTTLFEHRSYLQVDISNDVLSMLHVTISLVRTLNRHRCNILLSQSITNRGYILWQTGE